MNPPSVSTVILQMCRGDKGFVEYLTDFQFWKAFVCPYANNMGGLLVVGTLFYFGLAAPIYITTGSIIMPLVLLLLVGGAVMAQTAAPATPIAVIVLLFGGAGAITYLYYQFSR